MSSLRRHSRLTPIALILACVALLAVGCSSKDSSAPPATNTGGPALNFSFPATGTSHQFQFTTTGSFSYHCIPHQGSGMTGTVIVDAASLVDSVLVQVGPGNSLSFSPNSVTIKQNGFVRWVNVSGMTIHTVTRP